MQVINSRNNDLIDCFATNICSAQDSGQKRPAQSYPSIPRAGRIRLRIKIIRKVVGGKRKSGPWRSCARVLPYSSVTPSTRVRGRTHLNKYRIIIKGIVRAINQ